MVIFPHFTETCVHHKEQKQPVFRQGWDVEVRRKKEISMNAGVHDTGLIFGKQ